MVSSGSSGQDDLPVSERDPATVARLAGREALGRLHLLVGVSGELAAVVDDPAAGFAGMARVCVPDFCDLLALEVLGAGEPTLAVLRVAPDAGIRVPSPWPMIGLPADAAPVPVLVHRHRPAHVALRPALEQLAADSLIVAPVTAGGATLGALVLAIGTHRRGFRPSALAVAGELAARVGAVMHRVVLLGEARSAANAHARTARWLRRVGSVAAGLAGAVTPMGVLEAACVEARNVHDAEGAAVRWTLGSGRELSAAVGQVDAALAADALRAVGPDHPASGDGWVAWPLHCSRPGERATLVLFLDREPDPEEEISLRSMASLIPIAFERALATETAVVREAELRALFEASPGPLLTVAPDARVTSANPAARQLLGGAGPDGTWRLPPEVRDPILEVATGAWRRRSRFDGTVTTEALDLAVSAAPLPGGSDGDRRAVVAVTDLSERRRAERAMLQAQKLEAMGLVAGRVAHDFNNLLTLITGYSDLLGRGVLSDEQRHLLAQVEGATERAATLTQRMLGLTRRSAGMTELVDLGGLTASLGEVLRRLAGEGVEVVLEAPVGALLVNADPVAIEQVILNLTGNALDALAGTGRLTVLVEGVEADGTNRPAPAGCLPGSYARLVVSDDGPGMSAEVLARCTEPFFTTKPRHEGSGLGLSSVAAAAHELGGALLVDSVPELGTRVEVWVPRAGGTLPADGSMTPRASPEVTLAGTRVLVVEDDGALRELTGSVLTAAGAVVSAHPHAEAVLCAASAAGGPGGADVLASDVLVTDVRLPGLSGVELAARLRSQRPDLPVVFMTGFADPSEDRLGSLAGPWSRLLRKPFRPGRLLAVIDELVALQGSKR